MVAYSSVMKAAPATSTPRKADDMDAVFRALGDPLRRALLDALRERGGQSLGELCEAPAVAGITRQGVTKHLRILEDANLVATLRRGREKLHYLNAVPIHGIADRWISNFDRAPLAGLNALKRQLEKEEAP